jgi:hypothetical protein
MKAVAPPAPELDGRGDEPISAPMGRPGDLSVPVLFLQPFHRNFQDLATGHHRTLAGGPSGELAPSGAGPEISVRFRRRNPYRPSFHPHLEPQRGPKEKTKPFASNAFRRSMREEGRPEGPTVERAMAWGSRILAFMARRNQ